MIASLSGVVERVWTDRAVIDVGGVGYLVRATPATLGTLRIGERSHVTTTMVVREDSMTLYAFAADDERDIFEVIQGVQGIGPKTGLALLAVLGPDGLRRAVHAEDAKAVARVPGIGPKTAQRVILELGGKLAPPTADGTAAALTSAGGMGAGGSPGSSHTQVIEALVGLGFAEKNAVAALATITKAADAPTDTGALLRATLRLLGGGRG